MDGNFSAEHMAMRHPEDDVSLSEGTGYMVGQTAYKTHLSVAKEDAQVCRIVVYDIHVHLIK